MVRKQPLLPDSLCPQKRWGLVTCFLCFPPSSKYTWLIPQHWQKVGLSLHLECWIQSSQVLIDQLQPLSKHSKVDFLRVEFMLMIGSFVLLSLTGNSTHSWSLVGNDALKRRSAVTLIGCYCLKQSRGLSCGEVTGPLQEWYKQHRTEQDSSCGQFFHLIKCQIYISFMKATRLLMHVELELL